MKTTNGIMFGLLAVMSGSMACRKSNHDAPAAPRDSGTVSPASGNEEPTSPPTPLPILEWTVCRGENTDDDRAKAATCNAVCESTRDDCTDVLQASFRSNSHIVWKPGQYPVKTFGKNAFLEATGVSNMTIDADGAVILPQFSSIEPTSQTGFVAQRGFMAHDAGDLVTRDIRLNGLEMRAVHACGKVCIGISGEGVDGFYLKNTKVTGVKGFQYLFGPNPEGTHWDVGRVEVDGAYGKGNGTNDVIGGCIHDITITNSSFDQNLDEGTYPAAIDVCHVARTKLSNNTVHGAIVIGNEGGPSKNIEISGNTIHAPLLSPQGYAAMVFLSREDVTNASITDNIFMPFGTTRGVIVLTRQGADIEMIGNIGADVRLQPSTDSFDVLLAGDTVGIYDPAQGQFLVSSANGKTSPDLVIPFGPKGAAVIPVTGNWDGARTSKVGYYDPATSHFHLRRSDDPANPAEWDVPFGAPGAGWLPVAGDWTGGGAARVGLYDPADGVFYLAQDLNDPVGISFKFDPIVPDSPSGHPGWIPVAGRWPCPGANDSKGSQVGLYDPGSATFYLRCEHASGPADFIVAITGVPKNCRPITGDWDRYSGGEIGVYDPATGSFYMKYAYSSGPADFVFGFNTVHGVAVAGHWKGY